MKNLFIIVTTVLFSLSLNAQSEKSVKQAKGLQINTKAPIFSAINDKNETIVLEELLKSGPVVIIFYRGYWCPFCTRHLSQIQDSLTQITAKGATVLAISPEKPEFINKTVEATQAKFSVLFDEGFKISEAYGVDFNPKKLEKKKYNTFLGANLKDAHSDNSERLPIPATYVINSKGKIVWRHFDPNYKKRSSVKEIIDALKKL